MRRRVRPAFALLLAFPLHALPVACTIDFDRYAPVPAGSGGAPGAGGAATAGEAGAPHDAGGDGEPQGGAGGGPPAESCLNGVDDDGDGWIDCADAEDCGAGFTCTAAAPDGWSGPAQLFRAGASKSAPPCPPEASSLVASGGLDLVQEPTVCTPCTCGPAVNVSCTPADIESFLDASCSDPTGVVPQSSGPCNVAGLAGHVRITPPAGNAGACPPSGGLNVPPPAGWATAGNVCAATTGAGCDAGSVCAARSAAPFEPGLCVFRAEDVACPAGPYQARFVFSSEVLDNRACTACACGPGVASCAGTTTFYAQGSCSGNPVATVEHLDACSAQPVNASSFLVSLNGSTGSCAASGGEPIGDLVEGAPSYTVCCVP